jgi:hypothetical protein
MRGAGVVLAAAVLCSSCSSIERKTELAGATGVVQRAGPGDTVLDFKITKSLPNAFGKADILGRTTDAGRVVVRYIGVRGGKAIFERQDVVVESNKTTMTETPLVVPSTSTTAMTGTVGNTPVSAQGVSTSYNVVGPRPTTTFAYGVAPVTLTAASGEAILVEGKSLKVLSISGNNIEYLIALQ